MDRRTDNWAWGVGLCLYEMLTGRAPFDGDSVTDIMAKVIEREPDFTRLPAGTPPAVVRVLRRCLLKETRLRFQHIGDARLDLDRQESVEVAAATNGRRARLAGDEGAALGTCRRRVPGRGYR